MDQPIAELDDVSVLAIGPSEPPRTMAKAEEFGTDDGPLTSFGEKWILQDVSLSILAGGVSALLGPNGCGKSTLARVLLGQIWPTRGTVRVMGHTYGRVDLAELRRVVRLVQPHPIHPPAPDATALEVAMTGGFGTVDLHAPVTEVHADVADGMLQRMGVGQLAGARWTTMSTGERMRVMIARAMVDYPHAPRLLILDEPTAGLDLVARESLVDAIESMSTAPDAPAVLLITHHVEELPRATRQVLLMRDGRIGFAGPLADAMTEERLTDTFGRPVEVTRREGRYWSRLV